MLVLDEGRSRRYVRGLRWVKVRAHVCEQRRTVQTRFARRRQLAERFVSNRRHEVVTGRRLLRRDVM